MSDCKDVWIEKMVRPDNRLECCACMLLHGDDTLSVHQGAEQALVDLNHDFMMKKLSTWDLEVIQVPRPSWCGCGANARAMSAGTCIQPSVDNMEQLEAKGMKLDWMAANSGFQGCHTLS